MTATATQRRHAGDPLDLRPSVGPGESVLPELRAMWWETGVQGHANEGPLTVVARLPRVVLTALGTSWRADRILTLVVAAATVGSVGTDAFGLLATQRVLVELFAAGPTPARGTAVCRGVQNAGRKVPRCVL